MDFDDVFTWPSNNSFLFLTAKKKKKVDNLQSSTGSLIY